MSRNLRLQLIMDAAGNATRFLKGVKGETDAASKALRAARERVTDLQSASRDISSYRQMTDKLGQTREALKAARAEATRLAQAHSATATPTKQMTRAFEVARQRVNELKQVEQAHSRTLQEIRGRLDRAGLSTKNLSASQAKLARDTRLATAAQTEQREKLEALERRQKRMTGARESYDKRQAFAGSAAGAGASAMAGAAVVAAPIALAAREAMAFEEAMADVKKIVDFPTPEAFRTMSGDILNLSGKLGVAKEDLAGIMAQGARAGVAREDLLAFTESAAKMGVAFDVSADEAGSMMSTWRTAFGLEQSGVMKLADQVNALTNAHGGNAAAVAEMVTRIGPLAGVAGVAEGSLAALSQLMNSVGVQSEVGATGIKNLMLALTKGEAATKSQQAAFAALGLEAGQVAKEMQTDSEGAITKVLEKLAALSPDRQASLLTQLFGSESVAAIAPLLTKLDDLKRNFKELGDQQFYAGSMDKEYAARASTTAHALNQMRNNASALAVEVGSGLLPAIKEISNRLSYAAQHVRNFAAAHPRAAKVVSFLAVGLAAVIGLFGALALGVAAIVGPFALLQFALAGAGALFAGPLIAGIAGAAAATWGFTAALLANPITWIVVGVVALAAAAFLIYRNWGAISTWWAGIWTRIKEIGGAAVQGLISLFMNFTPAGLLIQAFQRVWPALQSIAPKFREFGGQLIMGLINGVLGGIPALVRAVMGAGGRLISGFKDRLGIRSPSRVFASLGDDTIAGLTRGLTRSAGGAVSAVSRVGAGMSAALAVGAGGAPAMAFDTGPRIGVPPAVASAGPAGGRPSIGQVTINIYQLPGENQDALARRVADLLKQPNLGALDDDAEGFD